MSDKTVTAVASFGTKSTSSEQIIKEIDSLMHLDDDGNEKSVFLPGEPVYFFLHYPSSVSIIRVKATDDGDVQKIGPIVREKSQQLTFNTPDDQVDLSYIPKSKPTAKWYGRESDLHLKGKTLQAESAPCLGDISYRIDAVQYMHRPTELLVLAPGEEFPIDIIIEYSVEG